MRDLATQIRHTSSTLVALFEGLAETFCGATEAVRLDLVGNLLDNALQPLLFRQETFDKLHFYSPQIGKTVLDEKLENKFREGVVGVATDLGFDREKDILLANGGQSSFHAQFKGTALDRFHQLCDKHHFKSSRVGRDAMCKVFTQFHQDTGGWFYRCMGVHQGQVFMQCLSCRNLLSFVDDKRSGNCCLLA